MKKILILAPYSAPSACGIWSRVFSDAKAYRDAGYEVYVFTSNVIKGTKERSGKFEEIEDIKIHRFRVILSLGENALFWPQAFFKIFSLNPDIIHSHGYRHPHTLFSVIAGKLIRAKNIITTHAPFEKDPRERIYLKFFNTAYSILIGWWQLRLYDKVIRISNWEKKYIENLGIKNSILIPNPIKNIFTKNIKTFAQKPFQKIILMSRIDPVKRPEWLTDTAKELPEYEFEIRGPLHAYDKLESKYANLKIITQKYSSEEFINELDKSDIFVLPSIRESFGIVLLEAMARGKIVISSDTKGSSEFLINGENGYTIKSQKELTEKIKWIYNNWDLQAKISQNAIRTAQKYTEELISKNLIAILK